MCSIFNKHKDILSYQAEIWQSCDIIRGHVKGSNIPNIMMPFFALIMMESRLVREYDNHLKEFLRLRDVTELNELSDDGQEEVVEDVTEAIKDDGRGYNAVVTEKGIRLRDICKNPANFYSDFMDYLDAYDEETRQLLGVSKLSDQSFLSLNTHIKNLRAKGVLHEFTSVWAEIDLSTFNNSEITTLEEYIKRKWADMSAETAGEHYTSSDLVSLISSISISYVETGADFNADITIYDMAVGGGNLLYGVEDKFKRSPLMEGHTYTTMGQEINDQLYALAKIESRFRSSSKIVLGDTLREDKLSEDKCDLVVANPPYGVSWQVAEKQVKNDESGRFPFYPSVSDGQLLFITHALSKMNEKGKGIIVSNGSPLFSGDVNSGESKIRKWIMDNDYLEALIQLPKDMFFNTSITTYLWVLNKDKPAGRKDKVLLIDASNQFVKLKKSKGKKTNEMNEENIQWVLNSFMKNENSEDVKVLSKYDFYYNKQQLTLLPESENGKFYDTLPEKTVKGVTSKVDKLTIDDVSKVVCKEGVDKLVLYVSNNMVTKAIYWTGSSEPEIVYQDGDGDSGTVAVKEYLKRFKRSHIQITSTENWHQSPSEYLTEIFEGDNNLGAGELDVKVTWQKRSKTRDPGMKLSCLAKPIMKKDYEIIPFLPEDNSKAIDDFISEWVRKEHIVGENNVGVEVNFNKIFYKPVVLRSTKEIAEDIRVIDAELAELEKELWG